MPAKSKKQQAYMAIAEHDPSKLRGPMPKMSKSQLHDFAATPTKNLPSGLYTSRKPSPEPPQMANNGLRVRNQARGQKGQAR